MRINSFLLLAGLLAFLFSACGEENPAVFPIDSIASEATSSSIQNAGISSSSLETSTTSSSEQTESSSQATLSSFLTVEHSSSSADAISSNSDLSSSGIGPVSFGEMTDERDGHVYKTVKIGEQIWMAENLNYAYPKQDSSSDSVSWCYNNEPDSCAKYGRLYPWNVAMGCVAKFGNDIFQCSHAIASNQTTYEKGYKYKPHGICPNNWHIPSDEEWAILRNAVNDSILNLKSVNGWHDNGNGTDLLGFSVLPTGTYISENGFEIYWEYSGKGTCFWTSAQWSNLIPIGDGPMIDHDYASAFCIFSTYSEVTEYHKSSAFSIRCVKDLELAE